MLKTKKCLVNSKPKNGFLKENESKSVTSFSDLLENSDCRSDSTLYSRNSNFYIKNNEVDTRSDADKTQEYSSSQTLHFEQPSRVSRNNSSLKNSIQISIKMKKQKKKLLKSRKYCLAVTPISTSSLQFSKNICRPQVRISVYDLTTGLMLNKQNVTNNQNVTSEHQNCFLTCHGEIMNPSRFSFKWNSITSTLIIDKETNYMQNTNIIIFLELGYSSDSRNASEIWKHIAWSYYRPNTENIFDLKNKVIPLQLFYFKRLAKFSAPIYVEWTKHKRKKYSAFLNTKFHCSALKNSLNNVNNKFAQISSEIPRIRDTSSSMTVKVDNYKHCEQIKTEPFVLPEIVTFKSACSENSKGSTVCTFGLQSNLLAFSFLNHKKSADIIILDLLDMKEKYKLKGHEAFIHYIELAQKKFDNIAGQIALSCSEDQTCIVWQILDTTYEIMHVLRHPTFVYCASFLVENFMDLGGVVTGSRDKTLRIWKFEKLSKSLILSQEMNEHSNFVVAVTHMFISGRLFSADKSGNIAEWESKNNKNEWTLRKMISKYTGLKQLLSHIALQRMYILTEKFLITYDIRSGLQHVCLSFSCSKDSPNRIVLSKCENFIFIAFKTKIVCWSAKSRSIIKEYVFHQTSTIHWIAFNSELNMLAASILNDFAGGCVLYSCEDHSVFQEVSKKKIFYETKVLNRFGLSISQQFDQILQKFDEIFYSDIYGENSGRSYEVSSNKLETPDSNNRKLKENDITGLFSKNRLSEDEISASNKCFNEEIENEIDRTFNIDTGIHNVVTVKENQMKEFTSETFTIDALKTNSGSDATDISENLESDVNN